MTNVGGDPARMSGGAATLHGSGRALEDMRAGLGGAGRTCAAAAGAGDLAAAAERFFAAWSAMVGDTGTQLLAAAQLAANAAADLATSGGH